MRDNILIWLGFGDFVTLFLLTVVGFASHQELNTAGWRLLTTFLPLCVAWLLSAPMVRLYHREIYASPEQLWRSVWAMLLAGPLAAFLRGLWLNRPILPVFVLVITASGMLGMLVWRFMFWFLIARQIKKTDG
ncbi:MAG: DUF3054 domain-containing protein [Anaerolineales bacterium]|nr:DUF3054 domain-containing protein [Anaerolineales bacterium]